MPNFNDKQEPTVARQVRQARQARQAREAREAENIP
jgi:hypothetical protein